MNFRRKDTPSVAAAWHKPQLTCLCHRSASVQLVTSLHRSDCFRLERPLPDGVRTRSDTAPFHGAHNTTIAVGRLHLGQQVVAGVGYA